MAKRKMTNNYLHPQTTKDWVTRTSLNTENDLMSHGTVWRSCCTTDDRRLNHCYKPSHKSWMREDRIVVTIKGNRR